MGLAVALVVSPAWAATESEGGRVGLTLFAVALLVTSAKIGGLVVERWGQPAVLGELLVGISLGNLLPLVVGGHGVDIVRADPTLRFLAEVGVLLLLFDVGLESDLRALIRVGPSALLVAVLGVVAPVALGWGVTAWLLPESPVLVHLFIGATLAATSVGITARVLRDLQAVQRDCHSHSVTGCNWPSHAAIAFSRCPDGKPLKPQAPALKRKAPDKGVADRSGRTLGIFTKASCVSVPSVHPLQ